MSYHNLMPQGRCMSNCPIRFLGRPGFVYLLKFLDQFAENVATGVEYRGLVYEAAALTPERSLPAGCLDVLDELVYKLFPSGELRCFTPRALQRAGPAGKTSWLIASQPAV